jgi:hypothetical protein
MTSTKTILSNRENTEVHNPLDLTPATRKITSEPNTIVKDLGFF